MKRQFLGDSKDSFKWDYHDYLATKLGYPQLTVALMMTPDDGRHGKTEPEEYPARPDVIDLCHELKRTRDIQRIKRLPAVTGAAYAVELHRSDTYLTNANRSEYFTGFDASRKQIVFLDPDNGFEPDKSFTEQHAGYRDLMGILEQISGDSFVSVFHHHRRISFSDDFPDIRERLQPSLSTAIYRHPLMFVAVAKSERVLQRVVKANSDYVKRHSVTMIA